MVATIPPDRSDVDPHELDIVDNDDSDIVVGKCACGRWSTSTSRIGDHAAVIVDRHNDHLDDVRMGYDGRLM